jgi:hypothetical protein
VSLAFILSSYVLTILLIVAYRSRDDNHSKLTNFLVIASYLITIGFLLALIMMYTYLVYHLDQVNTLVAYSINNKCSDGVLANAFELYHSRSY